MILFAVIFSLVRNNKLEVKFVILFVNFKVHGKNQFLKNFMILGVNIPLRYGFN